MAGDSETALGITFNATVRFSVLLKGKIVGSHVSTRRGNEINVHFEYTDRGRGPVLDSRIVLGPDGIPKFLHSTGNDYLKAPVEETFSLGEGKAQWKNNAESGSITLHEPAFYYSLDGSMEELGILAAALIRAKDMRLPGQHHIQHADIHHLSLAAFQALNNRR